MPRTTRSDPTAKLVGQAIRQARHDARLTQAQLARRLQTTTPYVTNVEAGRTNLTVGQLASIADALNAILDVSGGPRVGHVPGVAGGAAPAELVEVLECKAGADRDAPQR